MEHSLFTLHKQVRVINNCVKLHGHLCPQEMLPFHETLEKFFHRNYEEEIRRLTMDGTLNLASTTRDDPQTSQYQGSIYEQQSMTRTLSTTSTSRPTQSYAIQGPQTLSPLSPISPRGAINAAEPPPGSKPTPLQRHLAHLARHGINGVSSGPADNGDAASVNMESPGDSYVSVLSNGATQNTGRSNASVAPSNSLSSLKGRFSRFGSLNFGRRQGTSTS